MDFTSALTYPFKSIAKVLTIVLVTTIAMAVFLGMFLNSFDWIGFINALQLQVTYHLDTIPYELNPTALFIPSLIGFFIVLIVQGFWLSGYNVSVIRHVMDGQEKLPNIQFGKELLTGFYLFIASIIYGLMFVPFVIIVGMLMAMTAGSNGEGGLSVLVFCGAFLVGIPMVFLMGWAYFVGMARCAANDNRQMVFQIMTNLRIARQNVQSSFSLTGYMFLLGITFGFVSQFANNVLQLVLTPLVGNTLEQTNILLIFVLPLMLSLALNIIQEFSGMHLVAQYAAKIGIYDDYDDHKKVDFM
jgi:hypothetical protein